MPSSFARRTPLRWCQAAACAAVLLTAIPASAFKIVEPAAESGLTSGQVVTARVNLGKEVGIVKVRYYWYGELDEVLVEQEASHAVGSIVKTASLTSTSENDPPFGGKLRVPKDGIATMRLLAVAEISRGRLSSRSVFDEILVDVKPNAKLTAIEFETEKPLRFGSAGREAVYASIDSLGKTFILPVVGLYSDGVFRPIRLPTTGTTYRTTDAKILKVYPNGLLQLMGNGRASVIAANSGVEGALEVHIEVPDEPNEVPEADAGPDQTIRSGRRVVLNGLNSLDPEGGGLQYQWSQIRGAKVPLLDINMMKASFRAPDVSEPRLFRFSLRVTDPKAADSLPDSVDIIVEP